jgi:tetratricopeptide (TPR) repeat protein
VKRLLLLFFLFFATLLPSQKREADSLLNLFDKEPDQIKRSFLASEIVGLYTEDFDSAFVYYQKFRSQFQKEKNEFGLALQESRMGHVCMERSRYNESKKYYNNALEQYAKLKNDTLRGVCFTNLGFVDYSMGDYERSISDYLKGAEIFSKNNNTQKLGWVYNLLGLSLYSKPNPNYEKALSYYFKALEIQYSLGLRPKTGFILLRIGSTYRQLKDFEKAHIYLTDALKIADSTKNTSVEMWSLEALTQLYKDKKEYPNALRYSEKTLKIALREGYDAPGIIIAYRNFADINHLTGNFSKAQLNVDSAIYYSLKFSIFQTLPEIYLLKSTILSSEKNTDEAFRYYKLYSVTKDSLFNVQNNANINDLEASFDTKQKEKEIQYLNDQKTSDKKIKQMLSLAFILSLVLILVSLYAIFKINSSKKLLRNKNKEIALQKTIVEEKQKAMIDSINYARRIQQSLLPSDKAFEKMLNKDN